MKLNLFYKKQTINTMTKKIYSSILFILLLTSAMANNNWTLKKDKEDIQVYTQIKEGQKLKSSKVEMTVDVSVDDVLDVLKDIPNYVNWVPKTESAELLHKISDTHFYYYSIIKAPLVSNRDLVLEIVVSQKDNTTTIKMDARPNYIDEEEDLVRMPTYDGSYTLKDLGNGSTKITLEYDVDPGGSLPAWMANTAAVDMPYDTFANLKEELNN